MDHETNLQKSRNWSKYGLLFKIVYYGIRFGYIEKILVRVITQLYLTFGQ